MGQQRKSRQWIMAVLALLILVLLIYALMPKAVTVETGSVIQQTMQVTIDEEAKTRVREVHSISSPVAGRLLRVELEAGDTVEAGKSVLASVLPRQAQALDPREQAAAKADIARATAAGREADAELERANAAYRLAELERERVQEMFDKKLTAQANLDRVRESSRQALAARHRAEAAVTRQQAELAKARAQLLGPAAGSDDNALAIIAPIGGQVLRVLQESETTLTAGTTILELGDIDRDLEVVAELLSRDAVKVSVGDRVIIQNWGGDRDLQGIVTLIEPAGFTKVSALGVEEQRVNVRIAFSGEPMNHKGLGHDYRVDIKIIVWEETTLTLPASALLRREKNWFVFVVESDRVREQQVIIGQRNAQRVQLIEGLAADDRVVLYPGVALEEGTAVSIER